MPETKPFFLEKDYKEHKAGSIVDIPVFMTYFPWNYELYGHVATEDEMKKAEMLEDGLDNKEEIITTKKKTNPNTIKGDY